MTTAKAHTYATVEEYLDFTSGSASSTRGIVIRRWCARYTSNSIA